jgi:hypothetical protein
LCQRPWASIQETAFSFGITISGSVEAMEPTFQN